jgi:hypothetical protein
MEGLTLKLSLVGSFVEDLKDYREPLYGLLGDMKHPEDPSGNSLLYEAHAVWIARDLAGLNYASASFYRATNLLQAAIGLYYRKPLPAHDDETQDDYIGIASASTVQAGRIVARGIQRGWFFDTWSPNTGFRDALKLLLRRVEGIKYLGCWHRRFPGLVPHYKISAGFNPGFFGWLTWSLSILWTIRKRGNESGWLLDYLKLRAADRLFPTNLAVRLVRKAFISQLNRHYFGNVANVYVTYFGVTHPLARYSSWPSKPSLAAYEQSGLGTDLRREQSLLQ